MNKGRCLCGGVTIATENAIKEVTACHCGMCEKWSGGPFMSVNCQNAISIEGEANITSYRSSEWAERAFCKVCGTHLFFKLLSPETYFVPVELFDGNSEKQLVAQIYIDKKPDYYAFAQKTREMTEQEIVDSYQP
ncbi:GFA family protein [Brenneria populi]|uniref:GFA family protein n=1 Tax=Brenneria populi TaxID=1505588 RepID=A0ABU6JQE0_9GAMM|nr:GFA family protein [Brenneria populi Li et al. 2015]